VYVLGGGKLLIQKERPRNALSMKDDEFSPKKEKKMKDDETLALSVGDKRPLVLDKFKASVTNKPHLHSTTCLVK
jgi:hypothetical protein